jgi:hypothetical protein
VNDKLNEMWTALEAHEPAPSYAEAWKKMLKERTAEAAYKAACVAADVAAGSPPLSADAVRAAAAEAAAYAAVEVARSAEAEEDLRKVNAELLEALKTALHASWDGPMSDYARDKACAAIAKAEGVK